MIIAKLNSERFVDNPTNFSIFKKSISKHKTIKRQKTDNFVKLNVDKHPKSPKTMISNVDKV
jgi:hypothetical protein